MDLLRVSTAGSVDDGKSTLIGRLLFDTKNVYDDQLAAVREASRRHGVAEVELALLLDGLRAEREQGITIDVAYRYFATAQRAFVLADNPGHEQYTRNMVTGASLADAAILLVDARAGLLPQTRRHLAVAALLRVPYVILAVNKMDLVGFDASVFEEISHEFTDIAKSLGVATGASVPVCALDGDNVVHPSSRMPWYAGATVLEHCENVQVSRNEGIRARLPVQTVLREPLSGTRAYAGRLAAGSLAEGDEVVVLPSGIRTRIDSLSSPRVADFCGDNSAVTPRKSATRGEGKTVAGAGASVRVTLTDPVDVARGDVIAAVESPPPVATSIRAQVCVVADSRLQAGKHVRVRIGTREVRGVVSVIHNALQIPELEPADAAELCMNDLGEVTIRLAEPICADPYVVSRRTGCFLLLDGSTGATLAAGMIAPLV